MTREKEGCFSFIKQDVPNRQRYAYRLNGGPDRPDRASCWQRDGVDRASAVLRTDEFLWTIVHKGIAPDLGQVRVADGTTEADPDGLAS